MFNKALIWIAARFEKLSVTLKLRALSNDGNSVNDRVVPYPPIISTDGLSMRCPLTETEVRREMVTKPEMPSVLRGSLQDRIKR
jgi:hypothetical protein